VKKNKINLIKILKANQNLSSLDISKIIPYSLSYIDKVRKQEGLERVQPEFQVGVVQKKSADHLIQQFGISHDELERLLKARTPRIKVKKPRKTKHYKLGVVSDTHLCDKEARVEEIHDTYRHFQKEGITEVVHAGDVMAGMNVYRGQVNDLLCFGLEDQLNFVEKFYPKIDGITTYFITGNHDLSFKTTAGANIGQMIQDRRPDLVFLGDYNAQIELNGVLIELHHGGGGSSYALSYKLQKYMEALIVGQKPQIFILGHYHGYCHVIVRGIHGFLPMCYQGPNDLSTRFKLPNTRGGMILHMEVSDDARNTIVSMKPEQIRYYSP